MSRLKLMTIIGTRPEIIRLSACIKAFDRYFDHILVHTGQNWTRTLNEIFFDELEIRRPDYNLLLRGRNAGRYDGQYHRRFLPRSAAGNAGRPDGGWEIRIRRCR